MDNPILESKKADPYNYKIKFDVFIASPALEISGERKRFSFYEDIGEFVESTHRTIFIPHRNIDWKLEPKRLFEVLHRIVIPFTDIVLADLGIQDDNNKSMIRFARICEKPLVYFFKKGEIVETSLPKPYRTINFENNEEGLIKIKKCLSGFYNVIEAAEGKVIKD